MSSDTPPFASALAHDLRANFRALKRRFREQAPAGELTPAQIAVVNRLESGPSTASALARAEGMRPQSMGPIIAALDAAGVIQGQPDPADGRQTLLSLTLTYREQLNARREARQDWLERTIATRLTPEEQQVLARANALLRRIVEP
ncbi:MarR family winged helix-turn-helix transcriptional regulator [Novosphingobium terrae]|uniref:MarR family winged helix-turn-helix transcriptional regulator n=1 Tax=Novosphingobium terrae TaxID=2726189 RepID=UPI0019811D8D|nr:MarR family transcriptional regulator [Novosphingobium terrae]